MMPAGDKRQPSATSGNPRPLPDHLQKSALACSASLRFVDNFSEAAAILTDKSGSFLFKASLLFPDRSNLYTGYDAKASPRNKGTASCGKRGSASSVSTMPDTQRQPMHDPASESQACRLQTRAKDRDHGDRGAASSDGYAQLRNETTVLVEPPPKRRMASKQAAAFSREQRRDRSGW